MGRFAIGQVLYSGSVEKRSFIGPAKRVLARGGLDVRRYRPERSEDELNFEALVRCRDMRAVKPSGAVGEFVAFAAEHYQMSSSQLFQDLWIMFETQGKVGGFFVEFGAADGLTLSNTALLESRFAWRGILAEPAPIWHATLTEGRTCMIDTRCVAARSGETVVFNQRNDDPLLSGIGAVGESGEVSVSQHHGVETVSLTDLLVHHDAPKLVDYISMDTEGNEYEILSTFDFDRFDVRYFTIEHNYGRDRDLIRLLMRKNGYRLVFPELSRWDDWFALS